MANQDLGTQVLDISKLPKRWMTKAQVKRYSPIRKNSLGEKWSDPELDELLELGIKPYPSEVRAGVKKYLVPCYA
jgi:hypothetical protein